MIVDLLITNANIVNADGTTSGHIAIRDGQIAAIYEASTPKPKLPEATRVVDAQGRTAMPGGVDAHVHVEQVTGTYKSLDTYETASIAALWGGTTTIMDFGIPANSSETPLDALEGKLRLAEVSRCDVALHGSVIHWDPSVPAQLERMFELGVNSVKMYTTNRGSTMANDDTILKVMREMVRLGGLTYIHAEHDPIIVDCLEQHGLKAENGSGAVPIEKLHHTRPELAEATSVAEVIAMAEYTGAPIYFVHQTIPEAVSMVTAARNRGLEVYSETCPHYLTLDEGVYGGEFPEKFACCPPMRSRKTVAALVEKVKTGEVHAVSSDHSCYDLDQKQSHSGDIRVMPHGLPGIETRMPVAFTTLVVEQGMPLGQFVELFSSGPAKINRLAGKGRIAPGYDADVVLFDPDETRTVDKDALHMGSDFSPFEGMELAGWPSTVIMAGQVVVHDGNFTDPGPTGGIRRRPSPTPVLTGKSL